MSRYNGFEYGRGPPDRSRSPRFSTDRRQSSVGAHDNRSSGPTHRGALDAPRGPRPTGTAAAPPRTLREAPPLGSGDRGRTFRDRDYDRRPTPPRNRSPPRNARDSRDFPPRDADTNRARRLSRDGPITAIPNLSEGSPFTSLRGGYSRGRGRGELELRTGRGARRLVEDRDRDLYHRERSPPSRFSRDLSRDSRDADRRDDRTARFERREEDRRGDWNDRERDMERSRRDLLPNRPESSFSSESVAATGSSYQPSHLPNPVNPERLAIIEGSTGSESAARRPSASQALTTPREGRREPPSESVAYLNGRMETTASRYGSRGSSPPTQAPPVPAFSFAMPASSLQLQPSKPSTGFQPGPSLEETSTREVPGHTSLEKPEPPINAPAAPKAERSQNTDFVVPSRNRLNGVRSMESLPNSATEPRKDATDLQQSSVPPSPIVPCQTSSDSNKPVSPNQTQSARSGDLVRAPTGPKATRNSPIAGPVSPLSQLASPRPELGCAQASNVTQLANPPPSSAPSGPRRQSFSVSPNIAHANVPTAPKGPRGAPLLAPRAVDRGPAPSSRPAMPPFAPPAGPRSLQWNQWRRPAPPPFGGEKLGSGIPIKRDSSGDEKAKIVQQGVSSSAATGRTSHLSAQSIPQDRNGDRASSDPSAHETSKPRGKWIGMDSNFTNSTSNQENHSAAQSFFGKMIDKPDEENDTSSEEEELDEDEDATLLDAKHKRAERELKSQKLDLSDSRYRATTPLESIARLWRISIKDLQRPRELNQETDNDELTENATNLHLPAARSSNSDDGPGALTPKGDDISGVFIPGQEELRQKITRYRKPTPELISLPFMAKEGDAPSLRELDVFQSNLNQFSNDNFDVVAALEDDMLAEENAEGNAEIEFRRLYRDWREQCEYLNRMREEHERLERHQSTEPGPEPDASVAAITTPVVESRRNLKFSSEYDFEQVLKESEETARMEEERLAAERVKVQADMQKEARIPDQESEDIYRRGLLIDNNRLRHPDDLTLVFSYEPPADTFTDAEQNIFIAAFKDTPKKWGEVASLLPDRSYKDCIHHYYTNKWDGRFRDNRAKKLKGGRRGRGGKGRVSRGSALMADLRSEEVTTASDSYSGRPRRAAAPTTFGDKELESKTALTGPSPAKRTGPASKQDAGGDAVTDKGGKKRKLGEKPSRKTKSHLANLAAAPSLSPTHQFAAGLHPKDELTRAQNLEDAGLLANFQSGLGGATPQEARRVVTNQEGSTVPMASEDIDRSKPALINSMKPNASSYWSVPEQTDFRRYIAHFGTDFVAIAAHMGTKTHTMIKNHYQRQIDSGNNTELEHSATEANIRRQRGEDIGPPPTPTPIVKRKYESPQVAIQERTPRPIASQADQIDVDETSSAQQPLSKHASPPHFQNKSGFTTSAQSAPLQAQQAVSSPLTSTLANSINTLPNAALTHSRPPPHVMAPLHAVRQDIKTEPRSTMQSIQSLTGFRPTALEAVAASAKGSQPPAPPSRLASSAFDPGYIENLKREQAKAHRLQELGHGTEASHQHSAPLPLIHRDSPIIRPHHSPPPEGRTPLFQDRALRSPPSVFQMARTSQARMSQHPAIPFTAPSPASALTRGVHESAPPALEMTRSNSIASVPQLPSGPSVPTPALSTGPPKKSNLMSILNEEPRPTIPRDAPNHASSRAASPAAVLYPSAASSRIIDNMNPHRRDTFERPLLSSQMGRISFAQTSTAMIPVPSLTVKHEAQSTGQLQAIASNSQALERDLRHTWQQAPSQHRPSVGNLAPQSHAAPSPPPYGHSRTPSITTGPSAPPSRDHRSILAATSHSQSQSVHATPQPAHSSLYAPPPPQQLQFAPPGAAEQNRTNHTHNASFDSSSRPRMFISDQRSEEAFRSHAQAADRERELFGLSFRPDQQSRGLDAQREALLRNEQEMERHRQLEQQRHHEQRQQGQIRQHEQSRQPVQRHDQDIERHRHEDHQRHNTYASRPNLRSPHMPHFNSTSFINGGRPGSTLREQALRESEMAMQQAENDRRRAADQYIRDRETLDYMRRRPDEPPTFGSSTPSHPGSGYQPPPPQAPSRR